MLTHRDLTRHEIVRLNLLRSAFTVVETVVGANRAERLLELRQRHLTPREFARGDTYTIKSCSHLGILRRLSLH